LKIIFGFTVLILLLLKVNLYGQVLNEYIVQKVDAELVIDGKLDEIAWQTALPKNS
jgi:hypothetical protein